MWEEYNPEEYVKGQALVTGELLDSVRNLLSSALPEDASDDMIEAFWEKVYDEL